MDARPALSGLGARLPGPNEEDTSKLTSPVVIQRCPRRMASARHCHARTEQDDLQEVRQQSQIITAHK
jgi:hypothetical protein